MNISTGKIFDYRADKHLYLPAGWRGKLAASQELFVPNHFSYSKVTRPDEAILCIPQTFLGEDGDTYFIFTNELDHPIFFVSVDKKKAVSAPLPKKVLLLEDKVVMKFSAKPDLTHLFVAPKLFFKSLFPQTVILDPDVFNFLYEPARERTTAKMRLGSGLIKLIW